MALHEATSRRYLSYALSVITARALPDLRDGLKPVQRRILYAMYHNLHLRPDARYRKSAAVIGEVMAKYHPHGDQSIYDAMVRMAQPFSLRHMLVDGQGNFGSLDGDPPAAMRYTEAKLRAIALELLEELKKDTVNDRPNYDGQTHEPVVLPARFPQLLINGAEGIAVGMATRIPPHNLREIIDACVLLIDEDEVTNTMLCRKVKGPDFPTAGRIINTRKELREIYETGSGPVTVRGEHSTEKKGRKNYLIVHSLPYALNKAQFVEKIGQMIGDRKVPQLVDVRDESTDIVRIVLELRKADDVNAAVAWLYKHTPLQQRYHVNLTCLQPTGNPDVAAPARLGLKAILEGWLEFRMETVRRRFDYDLRKLRERIHILEGFELVFDALDEAIQIIRASEGKRDAAERLMNRFDLDDIQTDAILEIKLYRLAKLEILAIMEELEEKRTEAARIEEILASEVRLWQEIREELLEIRQKYGEKRRTTIAVIEEEEHVYDEDAYIVAEDTFAIVTRDGWIKRQSSFTDVSKIRIREGDSLGWLFKVCTRTTLTFFTDHGGAYTLRTEAIPATTGHGEPVQRQFKFAAGEKVIGVISHDPRNYPRTAPEIAETVSEDEPAPPYGVAVTQKGRGLRFHLSSHAEPSTRNGRRCVKLQSEEDALVAVYPCRGNEFATLATRKGHMLAYPVTELSLVRSAGKGFLAIKLNDNDSVLAFSLSEKHRQGALVRTNNGREEKARFSKHAGKRGAKGAAVIRRGNFSEWVQEPHIQLGGRGKGEE
ncbi:MAG: DNA topoisomerase (ATP-hydrolyzing) [Myxococcota bacterium]|nr:DNA topoisomerase (ATP-hydrolyzing) [Myxococcota bacterium]